MVVRRKEKHRKYRGKRAQRYGSHKKHRGGGSRGGRGMSGYHKHKWTYTVKYGKDIFGKKGFKRPYDTRKIRAINLKDLDRQIDKFLQEKIAEKEGDQIKINISKIGFDKVLGNGKITKPLIVEAKIFSKSAIKKLEEAGGKAVKVG